MEKLVSFQVLFKNLQIYVSIERYNTVFKLYMLFNIIIQNVCISLSLAFSKKTKQYVLEIYIISGNKSISHCLLVMVLFSVRTQVAPHQLIFGTCCGCFSFFPGLSSHPEMLCCFSPPQILLAGATQTSPSLPIVSRALPASSFHHFGMGRSLCGSYLLCTWIQYAAVSLINLSEVPLNFWFIEISPSVFSSLAIN